MTEDEIARLKAWLWGFFARAVDWEGDDFTLRVALFVAWCATLVVILLGWIICLIGSGQTDRHRMQWFHTGEWALVSWPLLMIVTEIARVGVGSLNRGVLRARRKHKTLTAGQRDRLLTELEPLLDQSSTEIIVHDHNEHGEFN